MNVSLHKHINPKLTLVQSIISFIDMTPLTPEMRKIKKLKSASLISIDINLKTKLVLILAKKRGSIIDLKIQH